jgi:hypothetical protein
LGKSLPKIIKKIIKKMPVGRTSCRKRHLGIVLFLVHGRSQCGPEQSKMNPASLVQSVAGKQGLGLGEPFPLLPAQSSSCCEGGSVSVQ